MTKREQDKLPPPLIGDRRAKVLIVDDDDFISGVFALPLERTGFDVHVVPDGIQALEAVRNDKPDLILPDLIMPKLDGFDTLTKLKKDKRTKDIPVLVLSSLSHGEDTARALELGAIDFMKKTETLPKECVRKVYETLNLL